MLWLAIWLLYGLVVGALARFIYPGDDPQSLPSTIAIGIAGSYMGGFINWLIGRANHISYSGFLMGLLGAVICCWIYQRFRLHRIMEMQKFRLIEAQQTAVTLRGRIARLAPHDPDKNQTH